MELSESIDPGRSRVIDFARNGSYLSAEQQQYRYVQMRLFVP